ncbi:uncharacterized protein LOC120326130 [Styela clava]
MDSHSELWLVTAASICVACIVGLTLRMLTNWMLERLAAGTAYRPNLLRASEIINALLSTYMLIVGTYEKCILIGKGLVLEYYVTTLLLSIAYSYILQPASPNPMSLVIKYWDLLVHEESKYENGRANHIPDQPEESPPHVDGLRRRGGDSYVPMTTAQDIVTSYQKRKPHSSLWMFIKLAGPSLLGQFLGLHTAIQWLHFTWDGYLTSHHVTKTGLLKDCIICLNTGPIQGFIIEGFLAFLYAVSVQRVSNLTIFGPWSFFVTSCLQSVVTTIALYAFVNVTGAFANPLSAYALERECLYDIIVVLNHIIVYVFGALAGTMAFKIIPKEKQMVTILAYSSAFLFLYCFTPNILDKSYIFM